VRIFNDDIDILSPFSDPLNHRGKKLKYFKSIRDPNGHMYMTYGSSK